MESGLWYNKAVDVYIYNSVVASIHSPRYWMHQHFIMTAN